MKTILVPTDLSENADQALRYALDLARYAQSKIILYHNMDIPAGLFGNELPTATDYTFGTVPITPTGLEMTPELEKIHREKLENLADQIRQEFGSTLMLQTSFNWGTLNENMNQLVQTESVDLVVMGTRGASDFLDRLIGTNTASYVKAAHCPVLVIPAGVSFRSFRHIAFAGNLEQDDISYLNQLLTLTKPFGAQITLINIKSSQQTNINTDEQLITQVYKNFPEGNFKIVSLNQDDIVKSLEGYVQQQGLDLLAVPIHEESFFASLFHSSISEKLTLHGTVPLLALPLNPYKHLA